MKTNIPKLKLKKKALVIFIEYFLFGFFSFTANELASLIFGKNVFNYWLVLLFSFFIYYSLTELLFNKSFGMYLLRVELDNHKPKQLNLNFITYSVTSLLDRTILVPIYLLIGFLNYESSLLCEKLSGINWKNFDSN